MPLVDCLKKILKSSAWEEEEKRLLSNGHQVIKLEDKQSGMKIHIRTGDPIVAMRTERSRPKKKGERSGDALKHLSCLESGFNKICDYLIIFQFKANYYAVFIEMKETMTGQKGYEQLRRSLPILDYLISACKIEYKINPIISVKYVLIAEKSNIKLTKGPVRTTSPKSIDQRYKGIMIRKFIGVQHFSVSKLAR